MFVYFGFYAHHILRPFKVKSIQYASGILSKLRRWHQTFFFFTVCVFDIWQMPAGNPTTHSIPFLVNSINFYIDIELLIYCFLYFIDDFWMYYSWLFFFSSTETRLIWSYLGYTHSPFTKLTLFWSILVIFAQE